MMTPEELSERRKRARRAAKRKKRRQQMFLRYGILVCIVLLPFLIWFLASAVVPNDDGSETLQTQSATTTVPEPVTETSRATLCITGDIMSHSPVINAGLTGDTYRYDSFFRYIKPYVSAADFAVANLETTLAGSDNGYPYSGFPNFNCPDAIVDALKSAGFDMLLTANNHCYDTEAFGLKRTMEVISDSGMLYLGTTATADVPDYTVQEINGIRIGMVSYTYGELDPATGQKAVNHWPVEPSLNNCINVFDYEQIDLFYRQMQQHIGDMKADGAQAILLFIHWGGEYQLSPNDRQKEMAQKLCDLGVDVIVGGHPHVIQPIALLTSTVDPQHKTVCAYSLGNALSNQRASKMDLSTGHTEDGMLLNLTFVKYSNGQVFLDTVDVLPTWVYLRYTDDSKSYDILPLDKSVSDWKSALNIGNTNLQHAQDSCERTMKQISSGLEAAEAYLSQQRQKRIGEYGLTAN